MGPTRASAAATATPADSCSRPNQTAGAARRITDTIRRIFMACSPQVSLPPLSPCTQGERGERLAGLLLKRLQALQPVGPVDGPLHDGVSGQGEEQAEAEGPGPGPGRVDRRQA